MGKYELYSDCLQVSDNVKVLLRRRLLWKNKA